MRKRHFFSRNSPKRQQAFVLHLIGLVVLLTILAACQQENAPEGTLQSSSGIQATTEIKGSRPATVTSVPTAATASQSPAATPTPTASEEPSPTEATQPAETATRVEVEPEATAAAPGPANERPEGALIAVAMDSQVGILLDEIPEDMRDRVAEELVNRPESFWEELARQQVRLTKRRLNFRNFFYDNKGQLPLPPEGVWSLRLDPAGPSRQMVQRHDLVVVGYNFASTLLTDADSPAASEPALAAPGGEWNEPFVLPVDPNLLLQRTGNACLNEAGFPPNSFDSENAWIFFDHTCEADSGGLLGCHRTRLHTQSCVEALTGRVGVLETEMRFERLGWDPELADEVRLGELTHIDGPDLKVVGEDLEEYRIIYRYFPADSCALAEQCVGGSGWRRLLQFSATVHNVGAEPMHVGPVVAENPVNNLFQFNSCHNHFHFSGYGDFFFADAEQTESSKQAFCVESTNRFSNNEWSPLVHPYTCRLQGVQAGWVDEYVAGLDCQWIDITDSVFPADGSPVSLGFDSNPNQFLCEGVLLRDDFGNPLWEPSGLTAPNGAPIERPQCDFVADWDVNNSESRGILAPPTGSFVTSPCTGGQLGPLRNCGFDQLLEGVIALSDATSDEGEAQNAQPAFEGPEGVFGCQPAQPVRLNCSLQEDGPSQVLRVCDFSHALATGVACTHLDALANVIVDAAGAEVTFACPLQRDENEPGGAFSLYTAPVYDEDESAAVVCTAGE